MKKQLKDLETALDYAFLNPNLIMQSLTHKSYTKIQNNERLEFLGDAVLDLVVAEYLYDKFPSKPEGELSKLRASIVSEAGFQKLALKIDLGKYMLISAAEENNHGRDKASLLSNAFEALMGAIYLENGLDSVKKTMAKLLESVYPNIDIETLFTDYKTMLQEITQSHFGTTPNYVLLRSFGPDHKKEFEIAVVICGREFSRSIGKTKKEAERKAAGKALEMLEKETL